MRVRVYPGTQAESRGVVVEDFGEMQAQAVDIGGQHFADPARRWAVALDTPAAWCSRTTYPNGKIYVGRDLTGAISYFGSPNAKEQIVADLAEHRLDLTVRKQILWESDTATDAEVRAMETKLIRETAANNADRVQLLAALVEHLIDLPPPPSERCS